MAAADYVTNVQGLYVAYYGRYADVSGLSYWTRVVDADGGDLESMVNSFGDSSEYQNTYSDFLGNDNEITDATGLVNELYKNMFDREGDEAGVEFYVDKLNAGTSTFAEIALDIYNGAQNADKEILDNKVAVAEFATDELETTGASYSGADDIATAQGIIDSVDAGGTSVASAQDTIETTYGGFTLTTSTDKATSEKFEAPQDFTPGGNDRVNTLQDEDELTGEGDSASLDATLGNAGDNGATTITPTLTDIKTVDVAFTGSDEDEAVDQLDLQDATGIDTLNVTRVSDGAGTATLDNLQGVLSNLSIKNSGEDSDAISVVFDDGVLSGSGDTLAFEADDVEVASLRIEGDDSNGYETINATATGDLDADDLQIDQVESLTLAGAGDVTLGNLSTSAGELSSIDASEVTGKLDVDLGAADVVEATNSDDSGTQIGFVYTGSQGEDMVRVDEDSLSVDGVAGEDDDRNDTVDGGTGQNRLFFTTDGDNAIDTAAPDERNGLVEDEHTVSNMQTVRIEADDDADGDNGNGDDVTNAGLDASTVGGLTTLELRNISDDDEADFDVINLGSAFNGGAGVVDVFHAADQGTAHTESDTDVQVHLADATGDDDTVTVHVETAENTNEQFDFTLDVEGNDADQTDLFDDAVESVTLVDNDTEDNTVGLTSASEHTGTLTLSGGRSDDSFTISSIIDAATVAATAQSSDVTLTLGTEDQDVDMGSGDDTLNFVDNGATAGVLTDDDDVDGGDGSDTISAGFTQDSDTDLNVTNVERVNLDANANVTVDFSESDDITTVGIVSNAAAAPNVTGGDEDDDITLNADSVATIDYVGDSDDNGDDDYNGLTITEEDDTSPESVVVNVDDAGTGAALIGALTLDSDTTSLTINNEDDNTRGDTEDTTFEQIVAAGLTSLTVTDAVTDADNQSDEETVIDLDDTTSLTSVDATEALGGVDLTVDSLADGATVDLQNVDDTEGDANDAVTVTFGADTGADDVTFTGGAGEETITITNGELDDLSVNVGGGNDTVTLTGASGENIEIDGGAGGDTLTGSDSGDEISGGAGADTITGGAGADTLSGGDGDDTFVFDAGDGEDTINNFVVGDDDFDIDNTAGNLVEDGGAGVDIDGVNTIDTAADITVADGLQIVDNGDGDIADADGLTTANIADRLNDTGDDNNGGGGDNIISYANAADEILFAISDGTDTAIVEADAGADDTVIEAGELTVLITLDGIGDAGTLSAANFDGFA